MEAFLENLFIVLPAVRVDMFIHRARPSVAKAMPETAPPVENTADTAEAKRFVLENRRYGIHAAAVLRDGEFIVEAGSTARGGWAGLPHHNYAGLYSELIRSGVLAQQGNHCVFTESYAFSSPSAAATVVFGRAASGPQSWRLEGSEMTYKEWEAAKIEDEFEALLGTGS